MSARRAKPCSSRRPGIAACSVPTGTCLARPFNRMESRPAVQTDPLPHIRAAGCRSHLRVGPGGVPATSALPAMYFRGGVLIRDTGGGVGGAPTGGLFLWLQRHPLLHQGHPPGWSGGAGGSAALALPAVAGRAFHAPASFLFENASQLRMPCLACPTPSCLPCPPCASRAARRACGAPCAACAPSGCPSPCPPCRRAPAGSVGPAAVALFSRLRCSPRPAGPPHSNTRGVAVPLWGALPRHRLALPAWLGSRRLACCRPARTVPEKAPWTRDCGGRCGGENRKRQIPLINQCP